jgi:serine/threonine protein kinase
MLQNPKIAFRDPELQQCRIEKDERNQPRPWAGAFAVVYKGMAAQDGRSFAVRIFTTESPERRERYDRISEYLRTRRLKCLVDFEYRDRSIRSSGDGKWYPLILMDWVQGDTLFKWVRARSLEGNRRALASAAERWVALNKEMNDGGIAHGDLQHANVMVTEAGELKLVDYDCMCVPALVGRRNLEVGVEPYQHPGRNAQTTLSLDLDNFSALLIYVALRALAADPLLWMKYVEAPAHDKLLFRKEDFQTPASSPLYYDLRNSPEKDVRELTEQLYASLQGRIDQVPSLAQITNSYAKIEQLLLAEQWDAAVQLLNRRGQFRDAPSHLKPLIEKAYARVCLHDAWVTFQKVPKAVDERHDRELVNAWNEPLFAGYAPAEPYRQQVAEARKRVETLDHLRRLVQQTASGTTFAREWNIAATAQRLPKKYEHGLRSRVRQARHRVDAIKRIERAVRELDDDAEIVAGWQRAQQAQGIELVNPEHRPRIELALNRLPVVQLLRDLSPDLPADQLDRRLLDLWQEELLAGSKEAETWRPAYEKAVQRRQILKRLEEAVNQRNEAAILDLTAEPSMAGYPLPGSWTAVIRSFRDRVTRTDGLLAALRDEDRTAFVAQFDVRLIRQYAERFQPYEALIGQWIREEILPLERIGLRRAIGRASLVLVSKREGTYRVRWTWPQQRYASECLLGIDLQEPRPDDDPRELELLCRVPLDRQAWESAGGSRVLHVKREWLDGCVAVWAAVDCGFCLFYSQPLTLGTPRAAARASVRGWAPWKVFSFSRNGKQPTAGQGEEALDPSEAEDERG